MAVNVLRVMFISLSVSMTYNGMSLVKDALNALDRSLSIHYIQTHVALK